MNFSKTPPASSRRHDGGSTICASEHIPYFSLAVVNYADNYLQYIHPHWECRMIDLTRKMPIALDVHSADLVHESHQGSPGALEVLHTHILQVAFLSARYFFASESDFGSERCLVSGQDVVHVLAHWRQSGGSDPGDVQTPAILSRRRTTSNRSTLKVAQCSCRSRSAYSHREWIMCVVRCEKYTNGQIFMTRDGIKLRTWLTWPGGTGYFVHEV